MHVVSVINYKGGVGKTTVTANLSAELAWRGYSVLAIDLDPQASLTFSLYQPDYWEQHLASAKTIKCWFDSFQSESTPTQLSDLATSPDRVNQQLGSNGGRLDLIASHLGLINVDLELAADLGGSSLRQSKLKYLRVHRRLLEGLSESAFSDYDVVLIDCPPNFNIVTKTAIVASDGILIPAKADYLSTLGIDYLIRNLTELLTDYNEYATLEKGSTSEEIQPEIIGVVFTMLQFYGGQPISALRPYIAQTRALGVPVFDAMLRENKSLFTEAPLNGVPVVLRGDDNMQHVVKELEDFADEFSLKVGL
ncbi:AAA family ATPase [Micromonospora sp. NPDC051196]|uniref:ParA family protein n=1 Tax=Micromonospora sp. NPDC051196 TaxID=3155281 RepID=UPI00342AA67A